MTAPLQRIERANVVLGVAVAALAGLVGGPRAALAGGIGALIGAVNFRVLARLAAGAAARAAQGGTDGGLDGGSAGLALGLVTALAAKMVALFVVVWAAQRILRLDALPFAAGLCVFVWSCLLVGLWSAARPGSEEPA